MPYFISMILIFFLACGQKSAKINTENQIFSSVSTSLSDKALQSDASPKNICWKGKLGGKIPVFIHYQQVGDLIVGEITYLKTKKRIPIRLIGELHNGGFYRLQEYDPKGNITGIIEAKVKKGVFSGVWIAPTTQKELSFNLVHSDSLIISPSIKVSEKNVFGTYAYAYGEEGYSGQLEIADADNGEADFYLISVTSLKMGPNIAEIEKDKVMLEGDFFNYIIPYSENCEIRVEFYKEFARVRYANGDCPGQFGHNATVEGIFARVKQ
ncbi:MAG TPA: hypothetical protein DCX89_09625 [Saprospirales bacterium]|nr:hypothetical protein [Saprospirales bacterium]HAY72136.1 hypothetical protein [Saprospirales bacterium]HRQ30602.1 hypothetical protein [Saprospiraceae bacterium]